MSDPEPQSDVLSLTRDLIRCPSVTPAEAGALDCLEKRLKAAGFTTHRPVFSEAGTPDIDNLYARIGGDGPCLVFAGHTDVVPPGNVEGWTYPPFSATIANGRLYGRGAEDMKGGVAASVAAVLNYLRLQGIPAHDGAIAFLITGDEEGPAINGTVKLLDWIKARGERLDHCILGEPTNVDAVGDTIKIGRRGSLTGHITVHGKQGHVAYPERADNPVHGMTRLLSALLAQPLDQGTAYFAPSNLEMTTVDVGNPTSNVVPGEARATFNIRFNDVWTPESLETEIRNRLDSGSAGAVRYTALFGKTNAIAFVTEPGVFVTLVQGAVKAETGLTARLSTTGGTSDARFIKNHCPVLEFGLIGRSMHQVDENIGIADLEVLTRIYGRVIEAYFKG
ncbi:MAG: succinyl-diaminopimelate desuccinylase [Beijerinckiaceae bacterium]